MKGHTLNSHPDPWHRTAALLMTLLAGALLAACASSTTRSTGTSTTTSSGGAAASTGSASARGTALRKCLAQHGVTLPSRPPGGNRPPTGGGGPGAGGGLFFGGGGSGDGGGRFANNPKLAAAVRACGGLAFRGNGQRRFQLSHTAINSFVACVHKHGYPAMPNPNFSGKGPVFPASIRTNKQFVTASRSCASLLVRPGANGAPSGA